MSRWERTLAGLGAAGVAALCLVLLPTSAPAAFALASPPVPPISIGTGLAGGGGAETVGVLGETVAEAALGATCWVCDAVAVGVFAYSTRDAWMPIASKVFGGLWSALGFDSTNCDWAITGAIELAGQGINGVASRAAGCTTLSSVQVHVDEVVCYAPGAGSTFATGSTLSVGISGGGGTSSSYEFVNVCPPGDTIMNALVHVIRSGALKSNEVRLQNDIPPQVWQSTVSIDCKMISTGAITTITATTSGRTDGLIIPSCADRVPGSIPWAETISGGPLGGIQHVLQTVNLHQTDPTTTFPDCFSSAGMVCQTKVWIANDPCTVGDGHCPDWYQYQQLHPDLVKCQFGHYQVSIADCLPLRYAYISTDTVTVTQPGWPGTSTGDPAPQTNTNTIPETGTNPSTVPGTAVDVNTDSSNCWGSGWSWNPVSWVYVPVKCALKWAFVPTNAPSFTDVGSPLPAGWIPGVPTLSDAGCGTITMPSLNFGPVGGHTGSTTLVNTCNAPWPTIRAFTYYGVLALVLVPLMFKAFNQVLAALGLYLGVEAQIDGISAPRGGWHDMGDY